MKTICPTFARFSAPGATRKRRLLLPSLAVAFLTLSAESSPVAAEGFALGARAGTPGLGVEMTIGLTPYVNVRGGFNVFGYSKTGDRQNVEYSADLKLRTFTGLLDLHPTQGAFRLTGGFFYNKNRIEGLATSTTTIEINDTVYTASQVKPLTATVRAERNVAPYVGIGFGNAVGSDNRLTFAFDLGVMFQGTPRVELESTGLLAPTASFQADLAQLEADLNADLDKKYLKYYPVFSIGFAYQF
jgi:hypothetical protein